jgi:tetratricopeptide (TPR) repeat protein
MTGRPDVALRWFEKVRLTSQQPSECVSLEGDCWANLLQDERAEKAYQAAATFQPDQVDGWTGLCYLKVLNGDFDGARTICNAQLANYQGSLNGRRMAALIEFFAGNFDAAETRFRALEEEDPGGEARGGVYGAVDYRSALACIALQRGPLDLADTRLHECLAAENERLRNTPDNPATLYRKAALEAMLNDDKQSLSDLSSAIAAGWLDFRSTLLDPRFHNVVRSPEFQQVIAYTKQRALALAQEFAVPAQQHASTKEK